MKVKKKGRRKHKNSISILYHSRKNFKCKIIFGFITQTHMCILTSFHV